MLRKQGWRIRCDCGWEAHISPHRGNTPLGGPEVAEALEKAFVGHLPASERRTYLLVDQRDGHQGNWLMPEGQPCQLVSHFEADGIRFARFMACDAFENEDGEWLLRPTGDTGILPVGEVRTFDGRVFRADLSAMTNEPVADRSTG